MKVNSNNAESITGIYLGIGRVFVIASLFFHLPLHAEPGSIKLGETDLTPELGLVYFGDDNVFRTPNSSENATGIRVQPGLAWSAGIGLTRLSVDYEGEFSRSGIESTDYDDHSLSFLVSSEFSKRSRMNMSLDILREAEEPGTGSSIGENVAPLSLNTTDEIAFSIDHTYGVRGAKGNFSTGLLVRNYSNNNENLSNRSDFTEIRPNVKFSLRLTPEARGFVNLQYRTLDYNRNFNDRDQVGVFLGIDWLESDKFGGTASLGGTTFRFPNAGRPDGSEIVASAGVYYRPFSYSRIDLEYRRDLYDVADNLDPDSSQASVRDRLNVDWTHNWSSRVSHKVNWRLNLIERGCTSDAEITNDTSLLLLLNIRRWITTGAGVNLKSRDFSGCNTNQGRDENFDFDARIFSLFVRVTL